MDNNKILKFFKESKYKEAEDLLKEVIEIEGNNADNYYYLFLASNNDYSSMDFNNLSNELYFNKALELADRKQRNQYESEFNFYKHLTNKARELFNYAYREKWELIINELDDLKSLELCDRVDNMGLFVEDMRNTLGHCDSVFTLVLCYYLLNLCFFKKNENYLFETMEYIKLEISFRNNNRLDVSFKETLGDIQKSIEKNKRIVFNEDPFNFDEYKDIYDIDVDNLAIMNGKKKSIEEAIIPYGIESIGSNAFSNCYLKKIGIPNSITYIESMAFYNCSISEGVYYDGTVEDWCNITFVDEWCNPMHCKSNFYIQDNNGNVLFNGKKYNLLTHLSIPTGVREICEGQFYGFKCLKSIEIPFGIKKIGNNAFYGCSNLENIEIPNSVTIIGEEAFGSCSNLKNIKIPNSVKSIGGSAFSICSNLANIEIPRSVISIGKWTFFACYKLENITFLNNITSIEEGMFERCISLRSIKIPNSVTNIKGKAFYNCTNLRSIEISDNITSIGNLAFKKSKVKLVYYSGDTNKIIKLQKFFPKKAQFILKNE